MVGMENQEIHKAFNNIQNRVKDSIGPRGEALITEMRKYASEEEIVANLDAINEILRESEE
jgi:hypothetical protein